MKNLEQILPIAIIIPVFNTSQHLKQCLDSILSQTYCNFHIYAIDDGSTDNSLDILIKYHQKDPRIKVFHQPNSGVGPARNRALSIIDFKKYSFISFIDSDDVIHPEFLEKLLLTSLKENCDISICGYNLLIDNSIQKPPNTHFTRAHALIPEEYIELTFSTMRWRDINGSGGMVWKALYKSSLLENEFFTSLPIVEDEAFCVQITKKIKKAYYIPLPLYYYRSRAGSLVKESKFYEKAIGGRILCCRLAFNYPVRIKLLAHAALAKAIIEYNYNSLKFVNSNEISEFYLTIKIAYENGYLSYRDWEKFLNIYNKTIKLKLKLFKYYLTRRLIPRK